MHRETKIRVAFVAFVVSLGAALYGAAAVLWSAFSGTAPSVASVACLVLGVGVPAVGLPLRARPDARPFVRIAVFRLFTWLLIALVVPVLLVVLSTSRSPGALSFALAWVGTIAVFAVVSYFVACPSCHRPCLRRNLFPDPLRRTCGACGIALNRPPPAV